METDERKYTNMRLRLPGILLQARLPLEALMTDDANVLEDQQEGLEDLGEAGRQYQAVINQADWTVETIIQQIDKGNIELNPAFQRREAWQHVRKSQYIESLILNVPVPQLVPPNHPSSKQHGWRPSRTSIRTWH
jgi:hypothetical protein